MDKSLDGQILKGLTVQSNFSHRKSLDRTVSVYDTSVILEIL